MVDYYEIPSAELAAWLRERSDSWWTVDGDPLLMGELELPCSGSQLADVFERANRPLLVQSETKQKGPSLSKAELEQIAQRTQGEIGLQLRWKGQARDWALIEDREVAELERGSAAKVKPR